MQPYRVTIWGRNRLLFAPVGVEQFSGIKVPSHQAKNRPRAMAASRMATAMASGRFHLGRVETPGRADSEWTRFLSSGSGLGLVQRLTADATIRLTVKAKIAVAKHCAMTPG